MPWLSEGLAEYARRLYGSEKNDHPSPEDLELGSHYTEGYGVAAGFLSWLEQHVKPKENSTLDIEAKLYNNTIVDVYSRYGRIGRVDLLVLQL